MNIKIQHSDIHLVNMHTRMPFRYGIATMTSFPLAFVRLTVEIDGRKSTGVSSDMLPPKWFTKIPEKPPREEVLEMAMVIENACNRARGMSGNGVFDLWCQLYAAQAAWGTAEKLPPLLVHFGTSLVERALIDAVCRAEEKPFAVMLHENQFYVRMEEIHPALKGKQPADFLPASPLNRIIARHTIGLSDPLTDADIPPDSRINDGLPQSLEACLRSYGLRHFKIKVNGEMERDLERMNRIAAVIRENAPKDFAFTLDGNEQYKSLDQFRSFWEALLKSDHLKGFLNNLLFVEQPLHRNAALEPAVAKGFADWPDHPPVIIDESDGTIESLPTALELGYAGASHKNCKGVFKGVMNRCLLALHESRHPAKPWLMSGEDLCNIGPVALLQDLAVNAALGIQSVERNGHHYVAGLSQMPASVQQQVLQSHPDFYHSSQSGWPTLRVAGGRITVGSLNRAPFGTGFLLDVEQFTPLDRWRKEKY